MTARTAVVFGGSVFMGAYMGVWLLTQHGPKSSTASAQSCVGTDVSIQNLKLTVASLERQLADCDRTLQAHQDLEAISDMTVKDKLQEVDRLLEQVKTQQKTKVKEAHAQTQ